MVKQRRLSALVIAGLVLVVAPTASCRKRLDEGDIVLAPDERSPREKCRAEFRACAPATRFGRETSVAGLEAWTLAHLAFRLDVSDKLAAAAADELLSLARRADEAGLGELQEAVDDATALLGHCRCAGFPPAAEAMGVVALLAERAPPRVQRTPEYWVEPILAAVAAERELSRRSAQLLAGGGETSLDELADLARRREEAERALCAAVQAARRKLAPGAFARAVDLVHARRAHDAGAGSADLARREIERQVESPTCEPPPEGDAAAP